MPVRVLSRFFHAALGEWRKGRIEAAYREQEWALKRGLAAERRKFALSLAAIFDIRRLAAQAMAAAPWARSTIAALLRERLEALRETASVAKLGDRDEAT
jgi:hypothetical protein